MIKKSKLLFLLSGLSLLAGCGGKNGLVSSGQSGVYVQLIAFTPTNPSLTLTVPPASPATQQFVAIATPNIGNPYDITKQLSWATTDGTVATINSSGLATAVGSGRTYAGYSYTDPGSGKTFTGNTILTVVPQLTGITVSPSSAQIAQGTTQQFMATGSYNDKSSADITSQVNWQPAAIISSSPGTHGLATGVSQGSDNITASLGGVSGGPSSLTVNAVTLVSLSLSPTSPTVPLATRQQLTATGKFSDGSMQDISADVSWSTLQNPSGVARVSATGVVTGIGLGSETITAQSPSGPSASTTITVDESSVAGINVLPVQMILQQGTQYPQAVFANGTKQQMRAVATFKDGSSLDVTNIQGMSWSSGNTSVATVDPASGVVTTQGTGSATILAALGSKQGTTSFNVLNAMLQSLTVAPNGAIIPQGGYQNVVATATYLAPDNLTLFQQDVSGTVIWCSDTPSVATVGTLAGLEEIAQAVSFGNANIQATFAGPCPSPNNPSAPLTVDFGALSTISVAPGNTAIPLDGGNQFAATGVFTDGAREDFTLLANWSAGNPAIATVRPMGYADASGPGQTSVAASFAGQTGASSLLVNPAALARIDICSSTVSQPLVNCPPLDPQQPPPAPSMGNQTQFGLVAIGTFTDGSRQDLTNAVHWASATPQVATVSDDPGIPGITTGVGRRGVLTGNELGGDATITATSAGISGSTPVLVNAGLLQSLTVSPKDGVLPLGQPQQLKVVGSFSDGSSQDVTSTVQWFTLNPDVAIVTPGGLAYTTGKGLASVLQSPSALVVTNTYVYATMVNPSATNVFSWPIGTVFQFQGLTVSSGDVSLLNNTPLTIVYEFDPTDPQHVQPCKPGQACTIQFSPPSVPPANGNYTVTAGTGQASALITATMNVVQNTVLTPVSGSTTLTVQ